MKTLLKLQIAAALAVAWIALFSSSASDKPKVRWLESPMTLPILEYSTNGWTSASLMDAYRNTDGNIQIGLRDDGVVIWRHR
jgi:hypothetical protein